MTETTLIELPILEQKCPECRGVGGDEEAGKLFRCAECSGSGYIPTPLGARVLALMRHNFRPMYEDARCPWLSFLSLSPPLTVAGEFPGHLCR